MRNLVSRMMAMLMLAGMVAIGSGCGGDATTPTVTTVTASATATATLSATTTPTAQTTVGLIAIGHSGLTGESSDPNHPEQDARQNSWATGTAPEVNSIYERLVVALPGTEGHVANTAQGGATSLSLVTQAEAALKIVPSPALVIIQTIDNDIRCDGTDDMYLGAFGDAVAEVLALITKASPGSKILMVNQFGRPATFALVAAQAPKAKAIFTGTGRCDFFDPSGELDQEHIAALTAIIEKYEAEQARVCAAVPQCSTDGGAAPKFVDDIGNLGTDWNHLNVRGLAEVAELMWPVVAALLGLS